MQNKGITLTPFNFHRIKCYGAAWCLRSTEGNTSAKRRKSRVGTHQINKLETQHTGTYNIVICYGVGKRYSR